MKKIIGSIQGRSGPIDIVGISILTDSEDKVFVDGIARNGRVINGGFLNLDSKAVEEAFVEWLESRGFNIHAPVRLKFPPSEILEDAPRKTYIVTVNVLEEACHKVSVEARSASEANQMALEGDGEYVFDSDKGPFDSVCIGIEEDETKEEEEEE